MLMSFFFIFPKFCFQHELLTQQDVPTHIITFNFNVSECNLKKIENIELNRIKKDVSLSQIPIKSMFLGTNDTSINIVVENLFSDELSCTGFFHIAFYKKQEQDQVYGEYVFEINKMSNGLFTINSETLKGSIVYLDFVFNRYLEKLYETDKKFSTVPKSNILCTKRFVANHKTRLKNYFGTKKGLKQTVISLNNCLSQIKEPRDIPVQIKRFFDECREELTRLNTTIARFEEHMKKYSFDVEDNLIRMMIDVLILLEGYTNIKNCFRYIFLVYSNISTSLKAVKELPIPDTLYKKKNSTILLRILPDQKLNTYFEKDLWFTKNKLYVSRDLCDTCRDSNYSLEIFNFNEKKKSMTLELYKAWM